MNYLIFIAHSLVISSCTLLFGRMGQTALISFISLLFVLANIFVIKQISLCGLLATSADAYIIGISFGINIIQEVWGKQKAQKSIFISFACSLFYVMMSYFQIWYVPALHDTSHLHFTYLMQHTLRIISASLLSYLIVQYTDTLLYAYLKSTMHDKHFIIRNYISMFSSQLFDTILFSFLGLYGIVDNITDIIIVSYSIKVITILLTTPFMYLAKKIVSDTNSCIINAL